MPSSSIEKRIEALEHGWTGKGGRMVVWHDGEPEPVLKRGQMCVRVYRIHMWGNGTPLTPAEIAAYHVRCAEIEQEREQRARDAEEAAAAREAERVRRLEARSLRAGTSPAPAPAAAAPSSRSHSLAGASDALDDGPVGPGFSEEELRERGWTFDPFKGLSMDVTGRRR